jgi:hypothetical protein
MSDQRYAVILFVGLAISRGGLSADAVPDSTDKKETVVTDANGKEVVLRKWKIVGGTRKLSWLPGDKMEFFEMRELGSTNFKDGVTTFVPMSRIESIKYDYDEEIAAVRVAGIDKPLKGTTKFKDINSITIEAEVDQGTSGIADLRYRGGVIKVGFKEVKFPDAKAPEEPPAKGVLYSFLVAPEGKGKTGTVMTAISVQGLYRFGDGSEKLLPLLMFKKTLKVDIGSIQHLNVGAFNVKEKTAECEVTLKDGMQLSVTLLTSATVDEKPASLVGLVGKVAAGWKLFPIHTIHEFQPGELKIVAPKDSAPKKESKKKIELPEE